MGGAFGLLDSWVTLPRSGSAEPGSRGAQIYEPVGLFGRVAFVISAIVRVRLSFS